LELAGTGEKRCIPFTSNGPKNTRRHLPGTVGRPCIGV
jgi:hypothetical protein